MFHFLKIGGYFEKEVQMIINKMVVLFNNRIASFGYIKIFFTPNVPLFQYWSIY